ncbi:MAG TPA: histidine kinase [Chitinophagaceae bacterium]|nr:histidine kinase [Chitinophagaceae bacterium]
MKEFIFKKETIQRIEFWAATTLFVFVVFFHIANAARTDSPDTDFSQVTAPFNMAFLSLLVRYLVIYCAFLVLNFTVVPKLVQKEGLAFHIFLIIVLFVIIGFVFGVTDTYLKSFLLNQFDTIAQAYAYIFQKSYLFTAWLLLLFGFYTALKYIALYLLQHSGTLQSRYRFVTPAGLIAIFLWLVVLLLLMAASAFRDAIALWTVIGLSSILLFTYAYFFLIPASLVKKHPYRSFIWKLLLILLVTALPLGLVAAVISRNPEAAAAITSLNAAFQALLVVPVAWFFYKRMLKGNEEIYVLKKALNQTHASFDFLRSQINPHFLFNALNTIYGTALQEGAERTGEGIEKLGDMMRFMLQENMQEKIALAREIDYLNNYISLQKLRTDPNPIITIDAAIQQPVQLVQIAPMLLIPFVENAFKHGISFREASQIRLSLELREHTLYFDVYNTKHLRPDNDPEKERSGIGLDNVKQRLQLLYPKKHELVVRDTAKDFFVHLTIQLT